MKIFYVLPKKNYFLQGVRGRVSHAIGLGDSLAKIGVNTTIVSGSGTKEYFNYCEVSEVNTETNRLWLLKLLKALKVICTQKSEKKRVILVRYASSNAWLLSFFLPHLCSKNSVIFGFEINSLAYHQILATPRLIRRLVLKMECKALERADFCYVVSDKIKSDITSASTNKSLASKIVVVPNGGPEAKTIGDKGFALNNSFKFIFFGIYQEYYNIQVVLDAFEQLAMHHKNIELHFYGDGPKLGAIKRASDANSKIFEHGRYQLDNLTQTQLVTGNTALLLPFSDENENQIRSPIKLFEYMCMGLPIVASDCAQISSILRNKHDGLLVANSDVSTWTQSMEEILKDSDLRLNLQKNVVKTYTSHTWSSRAGKLRDFINTIEIPGN